MQELKPLFIKRIKALLESEKDFADYLESLKTPSLISIRCNTLKISPLELKKRLESKGWKISQPWKNYPEAMIIDGKYLRSFQSPTNRKLIKINDDENYNINSIQAKNMTKSALSNQIASDSEQTLQDLEPGELGRSLEHQLGYYYVQDLASMLPPIVLQAEPHETILDLCSAPGSKTTQIAAEMNNTGLVLANEISLGRLKILAANLERCGVTNTIITRKEGSALCDRLEKQNFLFDKILIDAPCSGEGTLRNNTKTALMWNFNSLKVLAGMQKNLLKNAIKILKPKGELIYSTCTHAPEENEEVIDYILKNFPEMKIEKITLPKELKSRQGITSWENKTYSKNIKLCHRIYPHDTSTEGFFVARLRKK